MFWDYFSFPRPVTLMLVEGMENMLKCIQMLHYKMEFIFFRSLTMPVCLCISFLYLNSLGSSEDVNAIKHVWSIFKRCFNNKLLKKKIVNMVIIWYCIHNVKFVAYFEETDQQNKLLKKMIVNVIQVWYRNDIIKIYAVS